MGPNLQDGEFGAGRTILQKMKETNAVGIVVFVIRYYDGAQLGSRRFSLIAEMVGESIAKLRVENTETRKSCCLLSKWSFVNRRITSCKPADYKLGVLSFLLKNYCQLLSG